VNTLVQALNEGASLANVPGLLKQVIRSEMWKRRLVKQTGEIVEYRRFAEFVEDNPPAGLHTTLSTLIKICKDYQDMEAVDMLAKVSVGRQGERTDLVDNINDVAGRPAGTSAGYTMRRLAKDAPELHAQVIAGSLTPNQAAIEAGFRRSKFQMPEDASAAGRYLATRVDRAWLQAMIDAYDQAQEEPTP
jgi:hypothetical protein